MSDQVDGQKGGVWGGQSPPGSESFAVEMWLGHSLSGLFTNLRGTPYDPDLIEQARTLLYNTQYGYDLECVENWLFDGDGEPYILSEMTVSDLRWLLERGENMGYNFLPPTVDLIINLYRYLLTYNGSKFPEIPLYYMNFPNLILELCSHDEQEGVGMFLRSVLDLFERINKAAYADQQLIDTVGQVALLKEQNTLYLAFVLASIMRFRSVISCIRVPKVQRSQLMEKYFFQFLLEIGEYFGSAIRTALMKQYLVYNYNSLFLPTPSLSQEDEP